MYPYTYMYKYVHIDLQNNIFTGQEVSFLTCFIVECILTITNQKQMYCLFTRLTYLHQVEVT